MIERKILDELIDAYTKSTLMPVIGSGISMPFALPGWRQLIEDICADVSLDSAVKAEIKGFLQNAAYLEAVDRLLEKSVLSESELKQKVADILISAKKSMDINVDSNYTDLKKFEQSRFMTTNYDELLNDIVGAEPRYLEEFMDGTLCANEFTRNRYNKTVIPVHGDLTHPEHIVLSRMSYKMLYDSDDFDLAFQHIRNHQTFLFMGFSFDDVYFRKMFDRVIGRLESKHYILFPDSLKGDSKINKLYNKYNIQTIFYDTSVSHAAGIRELLELIIRFYDKKVDVSLLEKLPSEEKKNMPDDVVELLAKGQKAADNEEISEVKRICDGLISRDDYEDLSATIRQKIGCLRIWHYSYALEYDKAEQVMQEMDAVPDLFQIREKSVLMYAQLLWNIREWEKAVCYLGQIQNKDKLVELLEDIIKISSEFLPAAKEEPGCLKVYGETPWTLEEKSLRHNRYRDLKQKYVNEKTYNLLAWKQYKNSENQEMAYYWLGVVAGQVFHEHREAIEYFYRALEINRTKRTYEELAMNYLQLAEEKVRYNKEGKQYDLDREALLNARKCFLFAMKSEDAKYRESFYRKDGAAYLQVLYRLKRWMDYEEFYEKSNDFLPDDYGIKLQKAECDAEFLFRAEKTLLEQLEPVDRGYIQCLCKLCRANFLAGKDSEKARKLWREVSEDIVGTQNFEQDSRLVYIYHDCLMNLKDKEAYDANSALWKRYGVEEAFGQEVHGDMDSAEKEYLSAFEEHPDISTFVILCSFYLRHEKRKSYIQKMEMVLAGSYGILGNKLDFIQKYILDTINYWKDGFGALKIFLRFEDDFQTDMDAKKEVELRLRELVGDYSDVDERCALDCILQKKCPRDVMLQFYCDRFYLYISNFRYIEAGKVLDEMRREQFPVPSEMENVQFILMRPGKKRQYAGGRPYFFMPDMNREIQDMTNKFPIFRISNFALAGEKVFLPVIWVILLHAAGRQNEIEVFERVYLVYAGIVCLQKSLYVRENSLYRMTLQNIAKWVRSGKVILAASDLRDIGAEIKEKDKRSMEQIQAETFLRRHPEVFNPLFLRVVPGIRPGMGFTSSM